MFRRIMSRKVAVAMAAAALTTAALTACGSENAPAPSTTPLNTVTQAPAGPQVTVAAPPAGATGEPNDAASPAPDNSAPGSAAPVIDDAPITPVDPAGFRAYTNEVGWKSPSGKIYCRIGFSEYSSGCQSGSAPVPDGAGDDCAPNTSFTVDQLSKGFYLAPNKVTPTCFNQGVFGVENPQVLEYNQSISYNGFTCVSRVEAMVCSAGGGHGFALSMQQATWN